MTKIKQAKTAKIVTGKYNANQEKAFEPQSISVNQAAEETHDLNAEVICNGDHNNYCGEHYGDEKQIQPSPWHAGPSEKKPSMEDLAPWRREHVDENQFDTD